MRIKPIPFNYGELAADMPDTEILPQRKNVVVRNSRYTMWGEHVDPENQIMMLTSIAISRNYTKETKQSITDEWENYLGQYAAEDPEEIMARINEKAEKEAKRAAEAAKKAEEAANKAREAQEKLAAKKNAAV